MNKSLLTATLLLTCSSLAGATEKASAPPSPASTPAAAAPARPSAARAGQSKARKTSPAEAAVIDKFVSLQDAAIATFLELGDTLQSVKDKESADAAAPTVKMAGEQLYTIITAVEALGEPSEAAQQAIMSRVANVAEKNRIEEQVMLPLLTLMMQEPPCYGSEPLQTELTNLLANLQGAAGLQDEDVEEMESAMPLQEPDSDEEPAEEGQEED